MPLRLEDVAYAYTRGTQDPTLALQGVTLDLAPGKLVLVLGPTGSGKSTLLRLAAGLLAPTSGRVTLDGAALPPNAAGETVGLIFQDPESQLFADTVLDDVAFGPRNLGLDSAAVAQRSLEALRAVGLDPEIFSGRSPFSLSGGEARRAAIAGVLAMQPAYLLADEPTAGLDGAGRQAICRLLLEQRERAGVMIVSHAAEQFLGHADEVVVLSAGRTEWSGPAAAAMSNPQVLTTAGLALPDVLDVQHRVSACGVGLSRFSVDPASAAEAIATALGGA